MALDGARSGSAPRVAFLGTPRDATAAIEVLAEPNVSLVGVVAHEDPVARNLGLPVLMSRARSRGVPVLSPRAATIPTALEWLTHLALDYLVCAGWSPLLSQEVFLVPRHGVLGLLPALRPATRRIVAADWAVLRGGTLTGHVILLLAPAAAARPERARHTAPPDLETPDLNPGRYDELAHMGLRLLQTELEDAMVGASGVSQREAEGRSDDRLPQVPLGLTSFDRPAEVVHQWVMAHSRRGTGAFAVLRGERLVIWECEPAGQIDRTPPAGTVLGVDTGVVVTTRNGALRLSWVQVRGRAPEPATEWFTRVAPPPGCAFEPVDWSALSWLVA